MREGLGKDWVLQNIVQCSLREKTKKEKKKKKTPNPESPLLCMVRICSASSRTGAGSALAGGCFLSFSMGPAPWESGLEDFPPRLPCLDPPAFLPCPTSPPPSASSSSSSSTSIIITAAAPPLFPLGARSRLPLLPPFPVVVFVFFSLLAFLPALFFFGGTERTADDPAAAVAAVGAGSFDWPTADSRAAPSAPLEEEEELFWPLARPLAAPPLWAPARTRFPRGPAAACAARDLRL